MNILDRIAVTEILDIMTVISKKGRYEIMNMRKCYGLSFCKEGQITYTHRGKEYISDNRHVIILPKWQSYSISGDKSGAFALINFECAYPLCDTIVSLPFDGADSLIGDFNLMKSLSLFEGNRAKLISVFYNIIHTISTASLPDSNILLPAVKYIEHNYASVELCNSFLAKLCNVSEVYFRKLFATRYGISPKQYIIDIRINKAKQLLAEGMMKINAVSEKCGFSNQYHFCRLFKEKTGMTPSEYMDKYKTSKL